MPDVIERGRRQAETLAGLIYAWSEAIDDMPTLLRLIAEQVSDMTGDRCGLRLLSSDGQTLGVALGRLPLPGTSAAFEHRNRSFHRDGSESFFAAVIDRRETVRTTDTLGDGTSVSTPLVARARVIGTITLERDDPTFTDDDERFLRDIAQRAALAIDNAALIEDAKAVAARLRTLSTIAQEFSTSTQDLGQLLQLVTRRMAETVDDFAALRLMRADGKQFEPLPIVWHSDPELRVVAMRAASRPVGPGDGLIGQVAATGKLIRIDQIDPARLSATRPPEERSDIERLGLTSLLFLPMIASGKVVGVLCVGRRTPRHPCTDEETRFLQDVAVHAASSIANGRLLAEVRASERRFARLAESGLLGVVVTDPAGSILHANDTFLLMVGYTREDLETGGLGTNDLTPPDRREGLDRILQQLADSRVSHPMETEYVRKDGRRVSVLLGVAVLESGDHLSFVADLSDRKRAEQALRESEEQLRQAQKMEAIGRLAGGVAHDFNNLLSVILGFADLLLHDLQPLDPMREGLGEIYTAAVRAGELTGQLLMFSRQQVGETGVIDVSEVLLRMKRMLERVVGEDVTFTLDQGSSPTRMVGSAGHLEQVVMNLVVNARDAMPSGGRLTIEVAEVDLDETYVREHLGTEPGPHVMIAVSDTGVGMDRATQTRIFEPFFTTKPAGSGTGLGLSTVFGIVQQARGGIWVYSELGKGTTFKVYFPLAEQAVTEVRTAVVTTDLRGTETILLVEDEDQVRMVALTMLRRFGYRVIEARNAGEALLLCERSDLEIDLLLADVVMPQMSGPQLAARLAATRSGLRVLCMSGYTDDAVVRHGLIDGSIPFLQKPLTSERLGRKVREVLDAASPRS